MSKASTGGSAHSTSARARRGVGVYTSKGTGEALLRTAYSEKSDAELLIA